MANKIVKLAASILICLLAGAIGSLFTFSSIPNWYAALNKPWFTPPNWLFGPAWTTLYILMGIALFLVWEKFPEKPALAKKAISAFAVQLALNALWSIIFFGMKELLPAFIEIILLWIAILWTIVKFSPVSKKAALLLVPYFCWVSFAAALNLAVWLLNK